MDKIATLPKRKSCGSATGNPHAARVERAPENSRLRRSSESKGQSFVEVFVRRNKDSLSGVEVWRHHDGKFELYFGTNDKPNPADVHVVELAIKLLVDLSHRETNERIVSFREIAQRLGNTLETLRSVAGVIETSLKNEGIPAVREGDGFRLRLDL